MPSRRTQWFGFASALSLATAAGAAGTAEPAAAPPARQAQGQVPVAVEVEASRLSTEQVVTRFVRDLVRRPRDDSAAIWNRRLCPLVTGLAFEQAEFVLERISRVAIEAGTPLGSRTCTPNVFVIIAADPAELLTAWRRRKNDPFGGASRAEVDSFIASGRPVRAWYNVERTGADGVELLELGPGEPVPEGGRLPNTRLERSTIMTLASAVIVVDSGRLRDVDLRSLADHVAMLALSDIPADQGFAGLPTILNLFSRTPADATKTVALSDWDRAFLHGLYHSEQKYVLQGSQITRRMLETVPH